MPNVLSLYLPSLSVEFPSTSSVPGVDPSVRLPPQGLSASTFLPYNISIPGSLFPPKYFIYGVDPSMMLSLPLREFLFLLILSHQYVHLPIPSRLLPFSQTPHMPRPWILCWLLRTSMLKFRADILQICLLSPISPHKVHHSLDCGYISVLLKKKFKFRFQNNLNFCLYKIHRSNLLCLPTQTQRIQLLNVHHCRTFSVIWG